MEGTGIQSFVAFRAQIPRFAKTGITPWQTALKFRILAVAIRGTNIFFLAIRGLNTTVCHNPQYTFERGLPQQSEIQYPPFYIDRPPVPGAVSF
jgi:hypothetical protein